MVEERQKQSRRAFLKTTAGAVGVIGLAACAPPAAPASPPTSAPAASKPTEAAQAPAQKTATNITFLAPPWAVVDDAQLKTWSTQTGISVETLSVPNEQLYQKVGVGLGSQTSPADVIFLSEEAPSFIVEAGGVDPLDSYLGKDGASLNLSDITRMDFWKRGGKQYGLTAYLQFPMLDYNSKKLSAAGYSEGPKTWDEFKTMALAVKSKGVEQFPVAFAGISWSWYLVAMPKGDALFNDKLEPTFNAADAPGRQAMSYLVDLYKQQLISPEQLTQRDPHAVFSGGVGTLHQSWIGAHAVFNNPKNSKQAPDVKYSLLPEQHWSWGFDSAIGIGKFSKNKDAAWEFVKFYLAADNQQHLFDAFGLVPARESIRAKINQTGKNQQPEVQDEQGKYVRQLPRYQRFWGEWDAFVTESIRKAWQGAVTPDQAVDQIAAKWSELKG
jgi:multiple sugar transport system substrate-binding protein